MVCAMTHTQLPDTAPTASGAVQLTGGLRGEVKVVAPTSTDAPAPKSCPAGPFIPMPPKRGTRAGPTPQVGRHSDGPARDLFVFAGAMQ